MRNIFLYIILICAIPQNFAQNEEGELLDADSNNTANVDLEKEARGDIVNLLKNLNEDSGDDGIDTQAINIYEPRSFSQRNEGRKDQIHQLLKELKINRRGGDINEVTPVKGNLRSDDKLYASLTPGARLQELMENLTLNHKNNIKSKDMTSVGHAKFDNLFRSDKYNVFEQHMKKMALTRRENNNMLRKHVNHVSVKPEVYPLSITEDKYVNNKALGEDVQLNTLDLKRNDNTDITVTAMRSSNISMPEHYDKHGLLNLLYIKPKNELIPTRNVSHNNTRWHQLMETLHLKDRDRSKPTMLKTGDRLNKMSFNELGELVNHFNLTHRYESKANRKNLVFGDRISDNNGQLHQLVKKLDIKHRNENRDLLRLDNNNSLHKVVKKWDLYQRADTYNNENKLSDVTLRRLYKTATDNNKPHSVYYRLGDRQGRSGSRMKRSTLTQAGYTQDPDTCKTYNENLIKLWSNLSKYINVTEQPNEKALHNIAIMIQAYLEHENIKHPIDSYRVKHEGTRDKVSEVILKIRKMLDEDNSSPDKITKIIVKYLKPFYGDIENKDCQQDNEASLGSSVELLYKNYMENSECRSDGTAKNKQLRSLGKPLTKNSRPISTSEYKPMKPIHSEDEVYKYFHRGKMPRRRPTTRYSRVFNRSRKQISPSSINRSGNQNINNSEKLKARSNVPQKSSNKKPKKSSLKSDTETVKCEKYAIRKLTVSLRPVIDRFMALLECQLDNTLRSLNYNRVSMDPYYLYASKINSNDDNRRKKNILPKNKLPRKNTERSKNISPKKSKTSHRYDNSDDKNDRDIVRHGKDRWRWVRKYDLDQITGMTSASPVATRASHFRESNTDNYNNDDEIINNNNEFLTNYNEYFQSAPLYDDYDGIYKIHLSHPSRFQSLINPSISVNENKNADTMLTNRNSALPEKEEPKENQRTNVFNTFYEEDVPEEPKYIFNKTDQQADPNSTDVPFVQDDLITLKTDDQLINANLAKSQKPVKRFESITQFLKKARDASMQTPEFAVPFALDNNKGYVELTHLVKYPKILVYRPQFIVKNTMPYDDFLTTVNQFNMTNDEVRLMKIVRHLPDRTVKVLFETGDFETPLEVRNIKDSRRIGLPNPLEWKTNTGYKNAKYDNSDFLDEDSEGFFQMYRDEFVKSERSGSDEITTSNSNLDTNFDTNSTSNYALNPPSDSSSSSGLLSGVNSGFNSNSPDLGSSNGLVSAVGSAVGAKIGSGIGTGLDTALSIGSAFNLNPIHPSQLGSYSSKFVPSYLNSQTNSNPNPISNSQSPLNGQSDINSNSHSYNSHAQSQSISNSNSGPFGSTSEKQKPSFKHFFPSSTQSIINGWWKNWRNIFKGKIKKNVGKMATLADNIDYIETI